MAGGMRGIALGVALLLLVSVPPVAGQVAVQPGPLVLRVLDVGAGDASWVTTPGGQTLLVNCGPLSYGKQLVLQLQAAGVRRIDMLALSGSHAESLGGCIEVLRRLTVTRVLWSAQPANTQAWDTFWSILSTSNAELIAPRSDAGPYILDSIALDVFNPPARAPGAQLDEFDDSEVLVVDFGGTRVLLAGDIHATGEQQAFDAGLANLAPFAAVRVADHGSVDTTSQRFLDTTRPSVAIVSYGAGRGSPTPDPSTMSRINTSVPTVYTTGQNGTVTITIYPDGTFKVLPTVAS